MDLVAGVRRVIVLMEHVARDGSPKFKASCELPLTGAGVVDMLITDLAVFGRPNRQSGFDLIELAPGVTEAEVRAKSTAKFGSALPAGLETSAARTHCPGLSPST
jgi:3-oxoacid CoA-transferase subunit B